LAKGATLSAGTLKFQLGTWHSNGAAFAPGTSSAVDIAVVAGDSLDALASKINKAGIGVAATVFNDGTNQRLLLSSKNTGAAAGFRVQSSETGLQGFVFDPQASPSVGMAAAGVPVQYGADAKLRISGLPATSPTNTVSNAIVGVSIDLLAVTTTDYGLGTEVRKPATVTVSENVKSAVKNVQDLITAYNKINSALSDLVKYDAENKSAGLFQGDSTVVGLQSVLRGIVSSTSLGASAQYLADVGVERARDGSLSMNTNKLSTAANNGTLQKLFTNNNGNALTNGFALKLRDFGKGLIASGGAVANKTEALAGSLKKNTQDQNKVTDRATAVEARLRKQYTALDTKMASLNALNAYVSQQVTTWNKSTG
jgi:flagellar hook-associated protein 2